MIKKVSKKDKEKFNEKATHPLQTWEWGEFRKKTGNKVLRLANYNKDTITCSLQLTIHTLPLFPSLKIAALIKGPMPNEEILKYLKQTAVEQNIIFTKLEPNALKQNNENSIKTLKEYGAVQGKTLFTPTSFWIDLTKDENTLMKDFHSKTRYNIRYAKRKGVAVKVDNSDKAFERYIELTRETVKRQGFYAHTENYHRLMWQVLNKNMVKNKKEPIAQLLTATYQGKILTTWILFVWKDFLYYPYGASSTKHKNVQANNLMMWEAIMFGKKLGLKTFDLWGREPGKGFTKFKEGYNPKVVEFLGTWDLVSSPLYYPFRIIESLRWKLLRLRSGLGITKVKF